MTGSLSQEASLDLVAHVIQVALTPIFLLSGNLAVGGVPSDVALSQAIERHQLFYRAKPYSMVKLAKDLHHCLTGDHHEKG